MSSIPYIPHAARVAGRVRAVPATSPAAAYHKAVESTVLHPTGPSSLTVGTFPRTSFSKRHCSSLRIHNPRSALTQALGSIHCSSHTTSQQSKGFWKMADPVTPKEVRKYLQQSHDRIFENNKKWAEEMRKKKPGFFKDLCAGQAPEYLWIGCSDSRIPAEAITGLEPGEMFIHRNIANLVNNIDLNVMSVVNYAVRHLKVKHIVVCGHYGCGGVKAAMTPKDMGLLNPWLRNIRDVYRLHQKEMDDVIENGGSEEDKYNKLVELNVIEQCKNVIKTAAVQQCWAENEFPVVHGWVFGFEDGLLKDLKFDHEGQLREIQKIYDLTKV